uniref:30S ribosomal protein S20 n=1 Tax=Emiliania huxleyi TaxID=2903 RepID=A0A6T0FLY4_EMIHU|mmetsp:Transcript_19675/g.58334  ORF Transcript_19675/g.58334 Transcript_19675/m.58334 type:complete len:140 (+) Transcript_19675:45-464(+)
MSILRLFVLSALLSCASALVTPLAPLQRAVAPPRQPAAAMIALTKPQRTNKRRREYNKMYKSEMKTAIKRVFEAVDGGDYQDASSRLNRAQAIIDKNVKRNILHKNTAARRKSLLTRKVKGLEPGAPAAAAAPAAAPAE